MNSPIPRGMGGSCKRCGGVRCGEREGLRKRVSSQSGDWRSDTSDVLWLPMVNQTTFLDWMSHTQLQLIGFYLTVCQFLRRRVVRDKHLLIQNARIVVFLDRH